MLSNDTNNIFNLVVSSKDRAMQLDAFFQSTEKYASSIFNNIYVVYTASDNKFLEGYSNLIGQYPDITFIKESNYEKDIKAALSNQCEYLMFWTDDDLFFRKISKKPLYFFLDNEDIVSFCFSVGLNVNSYSTGIPTVLRDYTEHFNSEDSDSYISWKWKHQLPAFDWPLAVSCNVFKYSFISDYVKSLSFSNPNSFEASLQINSLKAPSVMASYRESAAVSITVNNVNGVKACGDSFYYAPENLNDLFLDKKRIDLESMDFSKIHSPHKEMSLKFKSL